MRKRRRGWGQRDCLGKLQAELWDVSERDSYRKNYRMWNISVTFSETLSYNSDFLCPVEDFGEGEEICCSNKDQDVAFATSDNEEVCIDV